ncbi:hypothetical protein [Acinetobacter thermotolerans]
MEQDRLVPQYQQLATQLLRISPLLYEFYQDQLALVKHVNAQNMFKLDREQH